MKIHNFSCQNGHFDAPPPPPPRLCSPLTLVRILTRIFCLDLIVNMDQLDTFPALSSHNKQKRVQTKFGSFEKNNHFFFFWFFSFALENSKSTNCATCFFNEIFQGIFFKTSEISFGHVFVYCGSTVLEKCLAGPYKQSSQDRIFIAAS